MPGRVFNSLACSCLVLASLACKTRKPDEGAAAKQLPDAAAVEALVVADGRGLLFSFFDQRATLRTVERIADVEPLARSQVMVTDPAHRLGGDRVHVADLRPQGSGEKTPVWIEQRGAWLARNMPKQSELKAAMLAELARPDATKKSTKRRRRRRRWRRRAPRKPPAAASKTPSMASRALNSPYRVVMFSTAWCPACKAARSYFRGRKIPFLDLDVERDRTAAQRMVALQQRLKLKRGAIPLIIINGRVLQGFSKPQVEAALAQAVAKKPG